RIAGVKEFINQFEDGYETVIGERGVGLSGGQRQRIALARAIIEDPSILVLDDTTSAVDMETEYEILNELKKINQDRTTFIIAHRISSVKDADLILVLDQGQIVESGSHDELIKKKGYYYEVFSQQMGEFDDRIAEVNYGF
ncbi:MAG: ATP-binding cassette domain-containing protein, partial [Vallitaleaceae bacterium]|nr:ATP-binding cassette domain-containing protein [Vallitaleaceae bacterium]